MLKYSCFTPNLFAESLLDISLGDLQKEGITTLIFDLDNTVAFWKSETVTPDVQQWFANLPSFQMQAILLSNNNGNRVKKIADQLQIPFIPNAKKPLKRGYLAVLQKLDVPKQQVAMVGDQLLTDVFGGKRVGVFTILVRPLGKAELWGTRYISRPIERFLCLRIKKLKNSQ